LGGMSAADEREVILAALAGDRMRRADELAVLLGLPAQAATSLLEDLVHEGAVVRLASAYLAADAWGQLQTRVAHIVSSYHDGNPLARGMDREELRGKLGVTRAIWPTVLSTLEELGLFEEHGTQVSLPGRAGGSSSRQVDVERVLDVLNRDPYSPPTGAALNLEAGVEGALLRTLVDEGVIVQLADGLYLTRDAYRAAVETVIDLARSGGQVSVAEVRDALPTTRKYALALLEYLDGQRVTRRVGDVRVLGVRADTCA
jgi:selenocysteine-specific elongation factor